MRIRFRFLSFSLAFILSLSCLAACDGGENTQTAPDVTTSTPDVTTSPPLVTTAAPNTGAFSGIYSAGLAYSVNGDGVSCTIVGIGTCTDSALIIPATHNGKSVTAIDSSAFSKCTSITSVSVPGSVTTIGASAFSRCTSLKSVVIDNGVTTVGEQAFMGCSALSSVSIAESVTAIGERAFCACDRLTSISFGGTKAQWAAIEKGKDWDGGINSCTVYCTDGNVSK